MGAFKSLFYKEFVAMPRKDISKAPELLCTTARELADLIDKFKTTCAPSDYRLAKRAYDDARYLLIDVRNLLNSIRGLAARR
jgi:hypothetical protein